MSSLQELEERIRKIEHRNNSVSVDKAWETSVTRRVLIALFTYLAIALYLKFVVGVSSPWLNAIIPSIGFLLSTFTFPFFKNIWIKLHTKTNK